MKSTSLLILCILITSTASLCFGSTKNTMYTNPVYDHDFPDPFVLEYHHKFYAYATESGAHGFQVMESNDLVHWDNHGLAFTPPWSTQHLWAPEVMHYRGKFYMVYSARNPETGKHDIGIAMASSPRGPFVQKAILASGNSNRVGVIDADLFIDKDKTPYLLYSAEDPRMIMLQKLSSNLLGVEGNAVMLIKPDQPWEHGVTEAPTMIYRNGIYHLFFSAGSFQGDRSHSYYAVYHAESKEINGPYIKSPHPLLATTPEKVYSPGHQCIIRVGKDNWWMLYHGWNNAGEPMYGSNPIGRSLRIDRILWKNNEPTMIGPTTDPEPAPVIR
jgi:beta-xylosidase